MGQRRLTVACTALWSQPFCFPACTPSSHIVVLAAVQTRQSRLGAGVRSTWKAELPPQPQRSSPTSFRSVLKCQLTVLFQMQPSTHLQHEAYPTHNYSIFTTVWLIIYILLVCLVSPPSSLSHTQKRKSHKSQVFALIPVVSPILRIASGTQKVLKISLKECDEWMTTRKMISSGESQKTLTKLQLHASHYIAECLAK